MHKIFWEQKYLFSATVKLVVFNILANTSAVGVYKWSSRKLYGAGKQLISDKWEALLLILYSND